MSIILLSHIQSKLYGGEVKIKSTELCGKRRKNIQTIAANNLIGQRFRQRLVEFRKRMTLRVKILRTILLLIFAVLHFAFDNKIYILTLAIPYTITAQSG